MASKPSEPGVSELTTARLLGIDDLFDGLTYCNYASVPFVCKPQPAMYEKAMKEAGVEKFEDCFFVG